MDKISVGDFVMHQDPRGLFCGSGIYDMVVVASVDPLILVSEEGDMLWTNIEKANLQFAPRASLDDCPKAVIDRLSRELVMDRAIAADEIERLLAHIDGNDKDQEIMDLEQRIEELEKESEWKAMKQLLCADYHIVPRDKIREAWKLCNIAAEYKDHVGFELLEQLGIVRCDGCNGYGSLDGDPFDDDSEPDEPCPDCAEWGSEGWVVKDG